MQIQNPFHPGELLVQELAGEAGIAERNGAVIADTIMPGALPFLRQQQMLVVGRSSPQGELWASILFGPPGFVESEDGKTLRIRLDPGVRDGDDPFWWDIAPGRSLGALAIDLASRRRLRINGRVIEDEPGLLTMTVDEAYPNCPKYIQRRLLKPRHEFHPEPGGIESGSALTGVAREIVEEADTLFVVTSNPKGGADVSHRGGYPGFVTVVDEDALSVPDYKGNSMFNTLGNLVVNPAAGILIVDFANLRILQMTGKAYTQWHEASSAQASAGTGRSWTFRVERWLLRPLRVAIEWEFVDPSPFNPH